MTKIRKVIKTGNSLAITIPSKAIKDFNIREGDPVSISVNRTKVSIRYSFSGHPRQLSLMSSPKN
ncbi:hypothetical protein SDC9_127097 [bioreactor metagenome]|uniref:SpoVT-AbrB domain-containing protein n=1 Tax=bioreactor metagenome TaxID=1076179 RepID=A0A645CTM7_9ZZZZ